MRTSLQTGAAVRLITIIGVTVVLCGMLLATVSAETLYVRSSQAPLKSLPLFSAENVSVLKQGDPMDVIEKKRGWFYITSGSHKGWVSAFFTSPQPVLKVKPRSPEKSDVDLSGKGRRRASSYSTSAAARGLYEERDRSGNRRYKPDFSALTVVDSYIYSEEEVNNFLNTDGLK